MASLETSDRERYGQVPMFDLTVQTLGEASDWHISAHQNNDQRRYVGRSLKCAQAEGPTVPVLPYACLRTFLGFVFILWDLAAALVGRKRCFPSAVAEHRSGLFCR